MAESASIDELMHAVLDGEASDADRARLEAALAADPALRERHAALQSLFGVLSRVSAVEPSADLGEAALARYDATRKNAGEARQLSGQSRVIASTTTRETARENGPSNGFSQLIQSLMGLFMSDQHSFHGARLAFAAVAIAAVTIVGYFGSGTTAPTADQNTTGTIAPAERYIAAQPPADDVRRTDNAGGVRKTDDASGSIGSDSDKAVDSRPDQGADRAKLDKGKLDADKARLDKGRLDADKARLDKRYDADKAKVTEKFTDKAADKATEKATAKAVDKIVDKATGKAVEKSIKGE